LHPLLSHSFTHHDLFRWLYEWIIALDACFKLSSKASGGAKRSDDEPTLAPGSGVFVKEDDYKACLKKNKKAADVRTRDHEVITSHRLF
jgi:hypothetical protein